MSHQCLDCDVAMEESNYDTTGNDDRLQLKPSDGLKGLLGVSRQNVYAYVCPECRLVRFYAER